MKMGKTFLATTSFVALLGATNLTLASNTDNGPTVENYQKRLNTLDPLKIEEKYYQQYMEHQRAFQEFSRDFSKSKEATKETIRAFNGALKAHTDAVQAHQSAIEASQQELAAATAYLDSNPLPKKPSSLSLSSTKKAYDAKLAANNAAKSWVKEAQEANKAAAMHQELAQAHLAVVAQLKEAGVSIKLPKNWITK